MLRHFLGRGIRASWSEPEPKDSSGVTLADLELRRGRKFHYVYDFGDTWDHELVVTKVLDAGPLTAVCVGGDRAGPPEDCGGPSRYNELVVALANPRHRRREELLDCIGDDFVPGAFSQDGLNAALRRAFR